MKKYSGVLKKINLIILLLAFLNIFAWSVSHVLEGGKFFGPLTQPYKAFIHFYKTVKIVLADLHIVGVPPGVAKADSEFNEINNLTYDVFALSSYFNGKENQWNIELVNLRDDSVHHRWFLREKDFYKTDRQFPNAISDNPILMENRSLIVMCNLSNNIYMLDAASNVIWHNTDKEYHHSINLDAEGNIWVCASAKGFASFQEKDVEYRDDFITKISATTGKIIYEKSVSEMLIENGFINFVYTSGDIQDPLHINDIEPVLTDGKFWKTDDVLISLRHQSLIIHYRPQANKIIRLIYGEFLFQHDVDIISDSLISIFNNNLSITGTPVDSKEPLDPADMHAVLKSSQLVFYNYSDSSFYVKLQRQFEEEKMFTPTQGLHSYLSNGDVFVETTDNGKVYILNDQEILLKRYMYKPVNNLVDAATWIRIYENINF